MKFDKFDVAKALLCSSIWNYVSSPYYVASIVSAGACDDILSGMKGNEKVSIFLRHQKNSLSLSSEAVVRIETFMRQIYSFLKHADRDPCDVMEIDERYAMNAIFMAIQTQPKVCSGIPIEAQVFEAWYLSISPEKIAEDAAEYRLGVDRIFPGIQFMTHDRQKEMCLNQLVEHRDNPLLVMHEEKIFP